MAKADTPPTVLIVDDSIDTTALMCEALRKRGFDTVELNSASECLAWLETRKADVVVTDVQMPVMSGLQLLAGLKQAYPLLPVVVVTGVATVGVPADARRLGAFDVVQKPVRVDALAEILRRALASS